MVERIIYIYQMGKVGSSSIANSISNFFKVIHVHHLSEEMAIYSKAQFKMLNIRLNGIAMR
ncbi:hypothetical protein KY334_07095 [Candidatus Woesearchaeota archaeon]|nr:hypothetical protein [Candidatus Woesearchaeota archaeon]